MHKRYLEAWDDALRTGDSGAIEAFIADVLCEHLELGVSRLG